jgi:hypothetical protein
MVCIFNSNAAVDQTNQEYITVVNQDCNGTGSCNSKEGVAATALLVPLSFRPSVADSGGITTTTGLLFGRISNAASTIAIADGGNNMEMLGGLLSNACNRVNQ